MTAYEDLENFACLTVWDLGNLMQGFAPEQKPDMKTLAYQNVNSSIQHFLKTHVKIAIAQQHWGSPMLAYSGMDLDL